MKRQNEPDPMGEEEAEFKKDPTLPVSLLPFPPSECGLERQPCAYKLPTLQARNHGNEPSKGAKIDAELKAEEEELLKKKGAFGPK